jgi:hypothetical protein
MQPLGSAHLLRPVDQGADIGAGRLSMGEPRVLDWAKVREVTGIFGSEAAAIPAVDDLLLAGFDRADIDMVAEGQRLRERIGEAPVPAVELADVPDAPRQEVVAPEDTAAVFAVCVGVAGCLAAMIDAMIVIASGGTTLRTIVAAVVGGVIGCGVGYLIARRLGWRWTQDPKKPTGTDGVVLWVRVRTQGREQTAIRILTERGAEGVRVHEIEIEKRLEDLPLSSLRPDPWLGDERLGEP